MYNVSMNGVGFAPMPKLDLDLDENGAVALGTPVPKSPSEATARDVIGKMQMSLNRPAPHGVAAGISPFTYKFDAKTRAALQKWLAAQGQPNEIAPGMWTRISKAGLGEGGAKMWEGAIAYYNGFSAPKTPKLQIKVPLLTQRLNVQVPKTQMIPPSPPQEVAAACSDGTLKYVDGEWKCIRIRGLMPGIPGAGAQEPTTAPETAPPPETTYTPQDTVPEQQTFVTYPDAGSGITPEQAMTMMTTWPEAKEALTEEKKGLPLWGWILIGIGGAAVVGGGIYLGIRSARG